MIDGTDHARKIKEYKFIPDLEVARVRNGSIVFLPSSYGRAYRPQRDQQR